MRYLNGLCNELLGEVITSVLLRCTFEDIVGFSNDAKGAPVAEVDGDRLTVPAPKETLLGDEFAPIAPLGNGGGGGGNVAGISTEA